MTAAEALAALRAIPGRPSLAQRRAALRGLESVLLRRADDIATAAAADFGGRDRAETLLGDVLTVVDGARYARRWLGWWARPRGASVPYPFWPARAWVEPVPKGVVGVMGPWNYPLQLCLWPAVDALAAGNRVVIKPSEHTPRVALLLSDILAEAPGPDFCRTVLGGPEVAADFAAQPWDHLVFTGGTAIGRRVMAAASDRLTPLTLELGGQCPAIVLPGADLARAAHAILAGKVLNAGQTCVAPDTVLLVGHRAEAFAAACRAAGPTTATTALLGQGAARTGALLDGAAADPLAPASPGTQPIILARWPAGHPATMTEKFGPVLGVEVLADLPAALAWLHARPVPLSIALFGPTRAEEATIAAGTRAGAITVGRCVYHVAWPALGFGGAGGSGFGRYHGRAGFDTFSDLRARVRHGPFALARMFDAPRSARALSLLTRLLRP